MTNAEHAQRLVAEADVAMRHRRALLCASVALATTSTAAQARRVLTGWADGPHTIVADAIAVLDALGAQIRTTNSATGNLTTTPKGNDQ
jgi:hypothetical protein